MVKDKSPIEAAVTPKYAIGVFASDLGTVIADIAELQKRDLVPAMWTEAFKDLSTRCAKIRERMEKEAEP